jgi:hypothetical protein
MDAHHFDVARFIRPVLSSIALSLSIIVISLMTMVKLALASGTIPATILLPAYSDLTSVPAYSGLFVGQNSEAQICGVDPTIEGVGIKCAQLMNQAEQSFGIPIRYTYTGYMPNPANLNPANRLGVQDLLFTLTNTITNTFVNTSVGAEVLTLGGSCPANSDPTPPNCTCKNSYVPDPTQTSCVNNKQYTLSLQTLSEMEPSDKTTDDSVTVIATVLDAQTQQPKAGATVSINVDVVANSGGHNHDAGRHVSPYTGTLDTTTGITGSDGTVTFTFTAPEVSGTHTFTATCDTCTNNPATTQINVKVDGLAPIPASVFYRFISPNADTYHPDNHNLQPAASAQLAAIAKAYYEATYLFKDGWLPNVMLNDASLNWGGILDCFKTCLNTVPPSVPWGPAHGEHRRGSVVDIRARLPAVNDPNNPQADTLLYAQEFIKAAKKKGADPYLEGSHYHLRLFGVKE